MKGYQWLIFSSSMIILIGGAWLQQISASGSSSIFNSSRAGAFSRPASGRSPASPTQGARPEGSSDGLWHDVDEAPLKTSPRIQKERRIVPEVYRAVRLNQKTMKQLLASAPMEFTTEAKNSPVVMTLPMPDGSFSQFQIQESPVMSPGLARQFPNMKTFSGHGVDDPAATARLDWSPAGFHAIVLSTGETAYIDPYRQGDTELYISYYKRDLRRISGRAFRCLAEPRANMPVVASSSTAQATGHVLRVYRLAVAATGEYTEFYGGTKEKALAGITTTMNRVNGVYERDFSIRWVLIDRELDIIYTNPNTDPYTNDDAGTLSDENQVNLDKVIGTGGYDLGHVFATSPGGVGTTGLCDPQYKAQGATGTDMPTGDAFDIDFVTHEMVHQLGGNHTFNALIEEKNSDGKYKNNCNPQNRSAETAYEPGSGTTAASYAGTCNCADIQEHSDDYFHTASIDEVMKYIASLGGNDCARLVSTGNKSPEVNAGMNVSIPANTRFTLTATGSDPDGDAITYCWEQFDRGTPSACLPDLDEGSRPIFRSFRPTTNPARTFPSGILPAPGESFPTITRTMNFRCTVRDNRGGVAKGSVQVRVVATGTAFTLSESARPMVWKRGSTQTVTWNVAGTNKAPFNTAHVRILISADGGKTFPITLVESAPNTGSATVTVPANLPATTRARLKVQAVGNVFFGVSQADVTINP